MESISGVNYQPKRARLKSDVCRLVLVITFNKSDWWWSDGFRTCINSLHKSWFRQTVIYIHLNWIFNSHLQALLCYHFPLTKLCMWLMHKLSLNFVFNPLFGNMYRTTQIISACWIWNGKCKIHKVLTSTTTFTVSDGVDKTYIKVSDLPKNPGRDIEIKNQI